MSDYLPFKQVRQTPEFAEYYRAAENFCALLEENRSLATTDFLIMTRTHLLRLYAAALAMPWVDLQSNKDFEEKLSVEAFNTVLHAIAEQLDEARYYWHIFDPATDFAEEPVCGDLLDDIGDIYKNLRYSLMIFNLDKEECEENALWDLKFSFDAHWGQHCINALSAIHFYLKKFQ